jgi:hypothetical protein
METGRWVRYVGLSGRRVERGAKIGNAELQGLYSSRNVIRVIELRRMRLAGCVAHTGQEWENVKERDNLEVIDVDGMLILK